MADLSGRVALVTGAGGGLGGAAARRLARDGAAVVLTDVDVDRTQKVADEVVAQGGRTLVLDHDVADEAAWQRVVATTLAELGGLDVLVNNAGIGNRAPVEEISHGDYARVIAVTQTSVFLGMQTSAEALSRSGRGSVINISSICGVTGTTGRSFAYHAAKGAVSQMTKNVAIRWASQGVRVNSIHPGYISTPPVAAAGEEFLASVLPDVPMGRLGLPEEVAAAVSFLAGDDASFITGSELHVDGGYLAR